MTGVVNNDEDVVRSRLIRFACLYVFYNGFTLLEQEEIQ
jgi:hypothetical protein